MYRTLVRLDYSNEDSYNRLTICHLLLARLRY